MKNLRMKKLIYVLYITLFAVSAVVTSCKKEDVNGFELGPLQKVLDGYVVVAIDFDSKGNAWIVSNVGLIRYNKRETIFYNEENSGIPALRIYDVTVDKNDVIWLGVDGGLLRFDGIEAMLYNSQNTPMPEDIVWSIAVDIQNNI